MGTIVSKSMLCFCLAAMSASMAMAQTPPAGNTAPPSHQGMRSEQHPFARPTERVEARLAYIKTALKITDSQQTQWDAYANLARTDAQEREKRFQSMQSGRPESSMRQRPNAIERLERQQKFHAEANVRIARLLDVEKPLYAALSPEQQKIADVVLNSRPQGMPGGGRSRRG